jgi:hypothetical protein
MNVVRLLIRGTATLTGELGMRNPYKQILANAKNAQNGWNKKHQKVGINRRVKEFTITWENVERVFLEQNGKSKWLSIPIDANDVFRTHYPLSPSLDRLDNDKDYTPDNICISTRFENYGFNKCDENVKKECVKKLLANNVGGVFLAYK